MADDRLFPREEYIESRETQPLLPPRQPSGDQREQFAKQLTTRHAFAVLVTLQIGSGIFASPAQVDSNVPSPGAALLVWALGGLLSWAGAAAFAELGAALPLNGGMQEYLRHVFGDNAAFLMAWVYIMAVKPSSMAIQSMVIAESITSVSNEKPAELWLLKLIASASFILIVLLNSINTKFTLHLSESFTVFKISTVGLIVLGGLIAFFSHLINPSSHFSGSSDWYNRNWFQTRPVTVDGHKIEWNRISTWDRYGHYCAAIYGGLWAYDGWDNANVVASEIQNPGKALPKAIKAAMAVVLSSYELVNAAYYIFLPWDKLSSSDSVAVAAATSFLGRSAGIVITVLVAISCAGSITSNVFAAGRLTIAASQRKYFPAIFIKRGLPLSQREETGPSPFDAPMQVHPFGDHDNTDPASYANALSLVVTMLYILIGSFRPLLTFVGMAEWVFYVNTVIGLLILRRREPQLPRPYRPTLLLPIVFIVVGILVIIRSAIFAPIQSAILAALIVVGTIISRVRDPHE